MLIDFSRFTTIKTLARHVYNQILSIEKSDPPDQMAHALKSEPSEKEFSPRVIETLQTDNILLTGVTGVLGGCLLKTLLEKTDCIIYCLVRAKDTAQAMVRIREFLNVYDPAQELTDQIEHRVVALPGDITKVDLGLSHSLYDDVAGVVDLVIHNASKVSLHGIYDALKLVNVDGTRNMIQFAMRTKQKYMVYVSSYTVFGDLLFRDDSAIFKEKNLDLGQRFEHLAYAQTKFESEKMIQSAEDLKWIIVRPGNIMGDHRHGYYPFGKTTVPGIYYDLLKTCIEMKTAPKVHEIFDVTPVDYIGKSIVYLSTSLKQIKSVYHLLNPEHRSFLELIDILRKIGFPIELVSPDAFFKQIVDNDTQYHSLATEMFKFRHMNIPYPKIKRQNYLDSDYTAGILEKAGITAPGVNETLIRTYLAYCVDQEYLSVPKVFYKTNLQKKETRMRQTSISDNLLSHTADPELLSQKVLENRKRISKTGDISEFFTVERMTDLLDQMTQFELGRFMIQNQGLDGYWSDYIISHPKSRRASGLDKEGKPLHELEKKILDVFPGMRATQKRFEHFLDMNQKMVKDGAVLCSIPCGCMRDLLDLDYSGITNIRLVGIDLDPDSLVNTKTLAKKKGLEQWVTVMEQDAWELSAQEEYSLISSSGLTLYEPNDDKVTALYKRFHDAIRPGGMLVTSYFTPPPLDGAESEWDFTLIDNEALMLSKVITLDICNMKFNHFRTTKQTKVQLQDAGFETVEFIFDKRRMFPTAVAYK